MEINHGPLNEVPKSFARAFKNLVFLDLSYNALPRLPKELGEMKLAYLKLANNDLNGLPASVWKNPYTIHLELDNNNISNIPSSLREAMLLNHLLMSNNSVSTLADDIFNGMRLVTLFIDGNHLRKLPRSLYSIATLRHLKLHNNYISHVSKDIRQLVRLHNIDLRNNTIKSLPTEIVELGRTLKYIYLHNNPICKNGWLDENKNVQEMIEKSPGAGCKAQCSIYCQDRYVEDKTIGCSRECNFKACQFQGGTCLL